MVWWNDWVHTISMLRNFDMRIPVCKHKFEDFVSSHLSTALRAQEVERGSTIIYTKYTWEYRALRETRGTLEEAPPQPPQSHRVCRLRQEACTRRGRQALWIVDAQMGSSSMDAYAKKRQLRGRFEQRRSAHADTSGHLQHADTR